MQVGRAGRGTETLWQVPEVRNLLRHLNHRNFMLRRYRIPWPWPRNGGEPVGSQEKAVGSSRGGNGDVLGIWQGRRQPGSLGESGLGEVRAARTCSLSWGRKNTRKEEALPRGVFCKTREKRRARGPELWFWFAEPLSDAVLRGSLTD